MSGEYMGRHVIDGLPALAWRPNSNIFNFCIGCMHMKKSVPFLILITFILAGVLIAGLHLTCSGDLNRLWHPT